MSLEIDATDAIAIMDENHQHDVDAQLDGPPAADAAAGLDHQQSADGPPLHHPPASAHAPVINAIGEEPAAPPPAVTARDRAPTHAVAALTSAAPAYSDSHGGSGIAPGDGDLMPPRFSGENAIDADDWAKDFRNYIRIRRVTPEFALMLLQNRLTGTARQWLESEPENISFDDVLQRFTRRFGMNEGARNELLATFWTRKQAPDEPARQYIELMQGLARKLRLGNDPLMRQGIIQGLLPDIQRDVTLQRPASMEALAEAAAIGERNAKLTARTDAKPPKDSEYYEARINRLEATIETMQHMMASERKNVASVNAVGGQQPLSTTMSRPQQPFNGGGTATGSAMYRARGRGRGYRGNGSTWYGGPPMPHQPPGPYHRQPAPPPQQQTNPSPSIAGGHGPTGVAPPAPQQNTAQPMFQQRQPAPNQAIWCGNCGRPHAPGHCRVAGFVCWYCSGVGHVQKCCPYLQAPPAPSSH